MTNREARMQLDDVERLSRLREGDLPEDEANALRLEIARTPGLARALARLERLDQLVSEHELISPSDRARSLAALPTSSSSRRWVLPTVAAVAAAALITVVLHREPEPAPAPPLAATNETLTAGVASLRTRLAGAQVELAPFSHAIVEDGSTLRLASGSVLVRGTARVLTDSGSLIGDGTFVTSTEPSRALADVMALHPQAPGDVMVKTWQQDSKSWAQTGLVVLVLAGSAQVSAGDRREVLSSGQASGPTKEQTVLAVAPEQPPEVQVVKAAASLTPSTPRPAEMVDLAHINRGVMTHEAALMRCLTSRPMPDRGQVVALLTLEGRDGRTRLSEATVSDEAPVDPLVASCVLEVLQRVDYPSPDGAELVQLKYPIEYSKRGVGSYLVTLPAPPGGAKLGLAPPRGDPVDVQVGSSPTSGPADAKVTVVLFTELECPFCERAHDTLERLRVFASKKSVRFVYKHLPLESHPFAREAALRLIGAHEQGRFWEYLQRAREQRARTAQALDNVALGLSLDLPRFRESVASPATATRLQEDLDEAKRVGSKAVPTWYVNGEEFVGARPTGELMKAIQAALER